MRRLNIEVNLDNLIYNLEELRKIKGCGENVIPTVKGNAYNVGVYSVVKKLLNIKNPQKKYCVFALKEGIELRKFFPEIENIFILNGILSGDEKYFKEFNLTPVVNSFKQLEDANKAKICDIAIQFNTGMNRSGINLNEIEKVKKYIDDNKINVVMVMSHFCCADDKSSKVNEIQIKNFKKVCGYFSEEKILKALSASDGAFNFAGDGVSNACRPGLALYGYYDGLKPVYSIKSYIESDGTNLFLPIGIANGFTSHYGDGNAYVLYNGVRIFVDSVEKNKIVLDTNDKSLINKEVVLLGGSISYQDFEKMCGTDIRDIIAKLFANTDADLKDFYTNVERIRNVEDDSIFRAEVKIKAGELKHFYSTILEKRIVECDGVVGYGATENVKKGDTLATFFGGYIDGIGRAISNKHCTVFVENNDGKLVECEIFGKVSMDQTTIKVPKEEFDNIKIGAKVILFDSDSDIEKFEKNTGLSKDELFFLMGKSKRIKNLTNN